MAIVIPSKNIYDKPSNAKIRDNVIDNVSVEITKIEPNNNYESPVFNQSFSPNSMSEYYTNEPKRDFNGLQTNSQGVPSYYIFSFAYLDNTVGYYNVNIKIKRLNNNKFISKLYNGKVQTENGEVDKEVIGISLAGETETGNATAKVTMSNDINVKEFPMSKPQISNLNTSNGVITLPQLPIIAIISNGTYPVITSSAVTGISAKTTYTIQDYTINDDYIDISLKVLAYVEATKLTGTAEFGLGEAPRDVELTGKYEKYSANEIEVTVYGNTIGISLTDGTISYGSGNHPYSLSGNELLQEETTTIGKTTSEKLSSLVLNAYKNGKETAKILCAIGEYKDEFGNLILSANDKNSSMTFGIGDLVIPMVFSAKGEDIPMSRYKDGTPKQFEVVKVNFIYDGATWQELTLQEYTKGE